MDLAPRGYWASVFGSSEEPDALLGKIESSISDASGTEFEIPCATSCETGQGASTITPKVFLLSLHQSGDWSTRKSGSMLYFDIVCTVQQRSFSVFSGNVDVSTEAETMSQNQRKTRQINITRRLIPLAGGGPARVASGSHERSREGLSKHSTIVRKFPFEWIARIVSCRLLVSLNFVTHHFVPDIAVTLFLREACSLWHFLVDICKGEGRDSRPNQYQ